MRAQQSAPEPPTTLAVRCQHIDGNVRYRMIYIASTTDKLARSTPMRWRHSVSCTASSRDWFAKAVASLAARLLSCRPNFTQAQFLRLRQLCRFGAFGWQFSRSLAIVVAEFQSLDASAAVSAESADDCRWRRRSEEQHTGVARRKRPELRINRRRRDASSDANATAATRQQSRPTADDETSANQGRQQPVRTAARPARGKWHKTSSGEWPKVARSQSGSGREAASAERRS